MTHTRFVATVAMVGLAVALMVGSAWADVEDVLLEKGVITKEDWLKIKAEKEKAKERAKEEAKEQKEQAVEIIPRKETPTTGELIAGRGFEKIRFRDVYLAPGGFVEATTIWRSQNQNADVGSTYGNIPLSGSTNSKLSEFRGTARQSRFSLLAETIPTGSVLLKLSGYVQGDFLGVGVTSNEQESNRWAARLRQFWATADFNSRSPLTVGQAWSLLTTHRQGLMPRSEFIPYTIDAQYVVGYNWARQFQVRFAQDFGNGVWAAFSIENPETNVPSLSLNSASTGNSGVVLPANVQCFAASSNAANPSSTLNG